MRTPIRPCTAAHRSGSPRRRRGSGLTLLEVLIALVLLAALTAIIAPTVLDRLDERAFEAAADGTNEQLMMARAHAQATGEAVEVTYSPSTGEVQARFYAPWESTGDLPEIEPGTSPLASSARVGVADSPAAQDPRDHAYADAGAQRDAGLANPTEERHAITEGWAIRPLGRGIRIGTQRPFDSDSVNGATREICLPDGTLLVVSADEEMESLADLEHGQDVRLAVFMPDGSAMIGQDLWLDDSHGRIGRITINPWSGLAMFHRLAGLTDESLAAAEDQENADSAPTDDDEANFAGDPDGGASAPFDERGD